MKFESRDLGKSFDKSKTSPLPQWLFPPNFGMLSFHAELPPIKLQVIFVFIQRRKMLQLNRTHPSTSNSKEKRRTWCHYSDISFYSEVIKKESQACKHVSYRFLTPAFYFINATLFRRHGCQKHNKKHKNIWCVLTFIHC